MYPLRPMATPIRLATGSLLLALAACNVVPSTPAVTVEAVPPADAVDAEREPGEAYTLDGLRANLTTESVDDNGDPIQYRYSWTVDGERADDQSGPDVGSAYTNKGEVWAVSVTAFDGKESSGAGAAEITIANTPPVATVELQPTEPDTTDSVRTVITKSDADLDQTTVRYVWILNGSPQSFEGETLRPERTNKGEVWEVQVIPTDGEDEGTPATATFTIQNTPPEFDGARLSTDEPDKRSELTCIGEGWHDEDGDPEGYQTEWFVNGDVFSTDDVLPAQDLSRGDRIRCRLTAYDGEDTGNSHDTNEVELENTPPYATSVSIGPEDPLKEDVVEAAIEGAVDPDGDDISFAYSWFINGSLAGETATLPPSRFRKGDSIRLDVRPYDGLDYGDELKSNTIKAGNNPPYIDEARLSPEEPYTDDVVTAEVFASDPDGDKISIVYEWYVEGSRVSASTEELDGDVHFDKGDEIYAIVSPNDGEDTGPKVTTDTITSINSVPTKPDIALDPTLPDGTEDALCDVVEKSTDADDDSLTYTFRWTVNGGAPSSLKTTTYKDDTLPASAYSKDDVLICTVTVSDGTATSEEAVAGTLLGSKERPGASCEDILDERGSDAETGTYWIDPDEDGDTSDAYQVVCDMESDGGGWTMVYYVDAAHFDGYYLNSTSRSSAAPDKINAQKDLWNIPSDIDHTETLLGCTTQDDKETHWWRWNSKYPYLDWNGTATRTGYNYRAASTRKSGSPTVACYSHYVGAPSYYYGFAAAETGSCGCRNIVWGANHYSGTWSSTGCNSTSTTYGTHTSKWRTKTMTYPICNRKQTSNGKFWIAVR